MNPEQQKIYDSVPAEEPRSRLEPYCELILRWRRQGKSYRRIQNLLLEKCSVTVSTMTLHEFVKRRSRPRKPLPKGESEQLTPTQPNDQAAAAARNSQLGTDPYAEARERMRRHKEAPLPSKPRKIFEVSEEDLDPTRPLRMMPPANPKEK